MQLFLDKMIVRQDEIIGLQLVEMGFGRMQTRRTIELARQDPIEPLPMLITPQADGTNLLGGIIARDPISVVAAITP